MLQLALPLKSISSLLFLSAWSPLQSRKDGCNVTKVKLLKWNLCYIMATPVLMKRQDSKKACKIPLKVPTCCVVFNKIVSRASQVSGGRHL